MAETLALALEKVSVRHRPRLLSNNDPAYLPNELQKYLKRQDIQPLRGDPNHPQNQGKIERWHRSRKNIVKRPYDYAPFQLRETIAEFVEYTNHQQITLRSQQNLVPVGV